MGGWDHHCLVHSGDTDTDLHCAHTVGDGFIRARVLDHVCGFEDERICGFTQDRGDVFDWTRQNHLTQNPKRSANTGPETDRSGTKEGEDRTQVLRIKKKPKKQKKKPVLSLNLVWFLCSFFRLLHVHRSIASACSRGQGSSALSTF